ncbi:hypothetical protein [Candidatus Viridilinea mediisalina]|uniref:hypothetical protein n=1 Tax=Candidatus Viridilinea mediisalina TaxID=2024553 RepID=UPI001FE499C4|nr:hypothetical protein [Candidatus Viridilinea mediisalina]
MPYTITRHNEDLIWVEMEGYLALHQAESYFVELWSILDASTQPLDLLVDGRRIAGGAPGARRRTEQVVHHPNLGHMAFVVGEYHLLVFAPFVKLVSGIGLFGNEQEALSYLYAARGRPMHDRALYNLPPPPNTRELPPLPSARDLHATHTLARPAPQAPQPPSEVSPPSHQVETPPTLPEAETSLLAREVAAPAPFCEIPTPTSGFEAAIPPSPAPATEPEATTLAHLLSEPPTPAVEPEAATLAHLLSEPPTPEPTASDPLPNATTALVALPSEPPAVAKVEPPPPPSPAHVFERPRPIIQPHPDPIQAIRALEPNRYHSPLGAPHIIRRPLPPRPASRKKQTPIYGTFDSQGSGDGGSSQ